MKEALVVAHGHCFDGVTSATLFTRLHRELSPRSAFRYRYLSVGYGPKFSMVPASWLTGTENAILDFRYTPSERTTWFFDHHKTGFGSADEHAEAAARRSGKVHWEPTYGSCAKLLLDVGRATYGAELAGLDELVDWADRIDTARYASAEEAVRRAAPALQLATVLEHQGDTAFYNDVVPLLLERSVSEVASSRLVQDRLAPLERERRTAEERVRAAATLRGRCVVTDLTATPLEVPAKFYVYLLFPQALYSVTLSRSRSHFKLSVGTNPWAGVPREHDIASLCARFGGGGHPAVGAAAFGLAEEARARAALAAVSEELA